LLVEKDIYNIKTGRLIKNNFLKNNFKKRMYIQRCFFVLSHTYLKQKCIDKNFQCQCIYKRLFQKEHMYKNLIYVQKFQKIMYLQILKGGCICKNIFIFSFKKMFNVSCNHYIADFLSPFL